MLLQMVAAHGVLKSNIKNGSDLTGYWSAHRRLSIQAVYNHTKFSLRAVFPEAVQINFRKPKVEPISALSHPNRRNLLGILEKRAEGSWELQLTDTACSAPFARHGYMIGSPRQSY
ncbi:hypothetical protein SCA6_007923 [Theobroma cacao]